MTLFAGKFLYNFYEKMANPKPIPETVKMDLRSILISASGTLQSKLAKEYHSMMGEHLPVQSLGFKHIYDFLLALEGEVCRMEYSPNDVDNIVFAIQDSSSFLSAHAKMNTNKSFTGLPHRPPNEIQGMPTGRSCLANKKSKGKKSNKSSPSKNTQFFNSGNLLADIRVQNRLPTMNDWNKLNRLSKNSRNEYSIVGQSNQIQESQARKLFEGLRPIQVRTLKDKGRIFISFPNYVAAFSAWMRSLAKFPNLNFEPATERQMTQWLSSSYKVIAKNIPFDQIHMTTLVRMFCGNSVDDLYLIETRFNQREAVAYYKTKEIAINICSGGGKKTLRGHDNASFQIQLCLITGDLKMTHESLNNQVQNTYLPPPLMAMQLKMASTVSPFLPPQTFAHKGGVKENSVESNEKTQQPQEQAQEQQDPHLSRKCGFILNYIDAVEMFHVTCKRPARTARNVADEINFIVSYFEDGCRFWVLVIDDQKSNFMELQTIEAELVSNASKVQPPSSRPKPGIRGAALFSEDEKWYRCYVLPDNDDENSDTITVFFVDYGNMASVRFEHFRHTYSTFWKLPPQAIPCKINGIEIKKGLPPAERDQAIKNLKCLCNGEMLRATVVKDAEYSQPHIVEIKDIQFISDKKTLDVNELCLSGLVCKIGEGGNASSEDEDCWNEFLASRSDDVESQEDESAPSDERASEEGVSKKPAIKISSSLYQFDKDQLVFGMIAEVHNVNLIYLQLGKLTALNDLERELLNHPVPIDKEGMQIHKGGIFLFIGDGLRRRVLSLEVDTKYSKTKILHVDYGQIMWVNIRQLFELPPHIQNKPFQARPSSLAGICCRTTADVTSYVRGYVKRPIHAHIVKETESGKLFVELFDAESGTSLNQQLIQNGLADAKSGYSEQEELEETASLISVPRDQKTVSKISRSRRSSSSSSSSGAIMKQTSVPTETRKVDDVKTWVNQHSRVEEKMRSEGEEKEPYRPCTPPFPPPDIVSSNTVKPELSLSDGVHIDGKDIRLSEEETHAKLSLDENGNLKKEQVGQLRHEWESEKQALLNVKNNLEAMLRLAPDELKEAFKEKRKQKLYLMLRMKNLKAEMEKVEAEYNKVVSDTEALLSSI